MFGLFVRFTCKDEAAAEAYDELVAETIEAIKANEPGTLVYASHLVDGQPLAADLLRAVPGPGGVRSARSVPAHPPLPGGARPVPGKHRGGLADPADRQGHGRVTTRTTKRPWAGDRR